MKNLGYLLVITLIFSACKKEEQIRMPVITGKVVDIQTQKGIAGIEVKVVDFWTDGWNYSVPITGTDITDSLGNFEVNYHVRSQYDDRILKLDHLPGYYQNGARINGENESCIYYDLFNDLGELFGGYRLEDEGVYKIELMPANTYAYIVPPVFPTAWLGDTIEISTRNWYNPLDESGLLTGCAHNYSSIKFPVSDLTKWDIISQPAQLKIGDEVSVTYKIYQNNIIRKSNALNVKCPFNDTTAIVLPL